MIWFLVLLILFFTGCAPKSTIDSKMNDDERLFKSNCISCHSLPDSKSKSDAQWTSILKEHSTRTKIPNHKIKMILNYLKNNN